MPRKFLSTLCVVVLVGAGCAKRSAPFATGLSSYHASVGGDKIQTYANAQGSPALFSPTPILGGSVMAASRYVAIRHKLEIVEPASELAKSVEAVVSFCGTIQCEVLSSNISGTVQNATPSGNILVRVPPGELNKLLEFVAKHGKIAQHATATEDKTAAVVDVEARVKNQTGFRDTLRKMLAKPGVSVADLLQIQEKLALAQTELDSETAQRKVLANETEKVSVTIEFRAESSGSRRSVFAPIGEALSESGEVLSDSLGALILAVAAVIPWLIILVPLGWLMVRWWKRWRARNKGKTL